MTRFRPCIDLHSGQVKQIIGGTLTTTSSDLKTNYVSQLPARHFAKLYKDNGLTGAHVIMLGPGNEEASKEALEEWRQGLQVGGGITDANAAQWIEWGAEKVCLLLSHEKGSILLLFQVFFMDEFEISLYGDLSTNVP
jgi:phosphoribosylformimino-5-aminoimidazole carboxamide ribotide isomerase